MTATNGSRTNGSRVTNVYLQAVALIGIPGAIAFYLLGMVPYTSPPIVRLQEEVVELRVALTEHTQVVRWLCYGLWTHQLESQARADPTHAQRSNEAADLCWKISSEYPRRPRKVHE